MEQTIRRVVESARGGPEEAKAAFWRSAAAQELRFLREFLDLGEGLPHGAETMRIVRGALADAGGDIGRIDQLLWERADAREFPTDTRALLSDLVARVAPYINGLIEQYSTRWREEHHDSSS